ncbi:hypothetical protein SNE40_004811 [Patella caerulea]|uniref:Mutator-like transposase domain-containing protein n=1 Tax=Patella caerulea TaxID=87958 RepID=A0AAN8PYK3_PATCE
MAANHARQEEETTSDVTVSCDGTWQKRGFSSKNCIATVLTVDPNGAGCRVVDTEVMSNYCNICSTMKHKLNEQEFKKWSEDNKSKGLCLKNHNGSAGAMEPAGMSKIFRRSVKLRKLRYTGYLGDGDSKSFNAVATADPPIYSNAPIDKLECCGHIQKRIGKRLMEK